ncbi:MAG: serine/threonine-protein kinase [Terriglobia bacterium]
MAEGARFCASCGKPATPFTELPTEAPAPRTPRRPGSSSPGTGRSSSGSAMDAGRFAPGEVLGERYRIIGLLGRGGMGEVYRADDLKLGQAVALKFLPESPAAPGQSDADATAMADRFRAEVRNARQVSHPNVCRVYDIGEFDGRLFLSMEYVDGEDLSTLLKRIGRLPPAKALEIARQLCAGLAAAHDKGVLHRDLKPSNIMIDGQGRARITDFGLAVRSEDERGEGGIVGTPAYMSPEQLAGRAATVKSDLYALGLVLYEIFTGKKAFEAVTLAEWKRKHAQETPTAPSSHIADVDPAVERVILRCLEKDPRQRPASALAVAAALPGGDPLAAALAAGETPSPELVAAAGETEGLQPRVAVAWLASVFIMLVPFCVLSDKVYMSGVVPLPNPPDALAAKAHELLQQFSYTVPAVDSASGFLQDNDYLRYIEEHDKTANRWEQLKSGNPSAMVYWYRESPRYLLALWLFNVGSVAPSDPARNVSGMIYEVLDPSGRLECFEAVPPQIDQSRGVAPAPDWPMLFKAAGLDIAEFKPADSEWTPPQWSDTRGAWTGAAPGRPGVPLRVEAAAYRGKPVYFDLIWPWTRPSRMQAYQPTVQEKVSTASFLGLFLAVLVGAVFLARRNLRLGRGDRRGAFRLAIFVLVLLVLAWGIEAHHLPDVEEFVLFVIITSAALFIAAFVWLLYIGLEPFVRRRWPNALISWNRVLAGQFRDPLVGSNVLMGVALGVAGACLLDTLRHFAEGWFGRLPPRPMTIALDPLLGVRGMIAQLLGTLPIELGVALALFFLFVLLRLLLRKDWVAAAALVLIFTAANALSERYLLVDAVVNAVYWGITIFILMRFGLFPLMAFFLTYDLLNLFVHSMHLSQWHAASTILGVLSVLALAVYGFHVSLAGRPVFSGAALDE